jgi:quercetin dioxygenase-like cupin family protein
MTDMASSQLEIERLATERRRSDTGGVSHFTGEVWTRRLFDSDSEEAPVRVSGIEFIAEARTFWHEHPEEQTLHILAGECRVGTEDAAKQSFAAGETVRLARLRRHWHGAAPGGDMTHISITSGAEPTWYGPPPANH